MAATAQAVGEVPYADVGAIPPAEAYAVPPDSVPAYAVAPEGTYAEGAYAPPVEGVTTFDADPEMLPTADGTVAGDNSGDSQEEKRLKRMRRNRESAAMSRNRKKQYVEELEATVASLKDTVQNLHSENFELRREHARLTGQPMPEPPPTAVAVLTPLEAPAAATGAEDEPEPIEAVSTVAPATVAQDAVAPSPRANDALLGLELLSRSASINGNGEGGAGDASAPVQVVAESVVTAPEVPEGGATATAEEPTDPPVVDVASI